MAALLERVSQAGQAIRLAWRGAEHAGVAQDSDEFPTAVLPVIRDQAPVATDDEDTEPTTAQREVRRWLRPLGFSWWQQSLARI